MRDPSFHILIVEDDAKIARILEKAFADSGYDTTLASEGNQALALARQGNFDLVVSDVMVPGRDGFSVVEELRAQGNQTPVLFLSAKHSAEDRIEGLQKGGDDYIVKPFSLPEVLLRARAILRRANRTSEAFPLKYEDLEIDLLSRKAFRSRQKIELHPKEFALLECLLRHRGRVLSKSQILDKIWKYDFDPQTNVVDVLVCRLRNKVDRGFERKLIKTIRGVGYVLQGE